MPLHAVQVKFLSVGSPLSPIPCLGSLRPNTILHASSRVVTVSWCQNIEISEEISIVQRSLVVIVLVLVAIYTVRYFFGKL